MADHERPLLVLQRRHASHPPEIPESMIRLIRRDFDDLVAAGVLRNTAEAAEQFIDGYLWHEGLRSQASPAELRALVFPDLEAR